MTVREYGVLTIAVIGLGVIGYGVVILSRDCVKIGIAIIACGFLTDLVG